MDSTLESSNQDLQHHRTGHRCLQGSRSSFSRRCYRYCIIIIKNIRYYYVLYCRWPWFTTNTTMNLFQASLWTYTMPPGTPRARHTKRDKFNHDWSNLQYSSRRVVPPAGSMQYTCMRDRHTHVLFIPLLHPTHMALKKYGKCNPLFPRSQPSCYKTWIDQILTTRQGVAIIVPGHSGESLLPIYPAKQNIGSCHLHASMGVVDGASTWTPSYANITKMGPRNKEGIVPSAATTTITITSDTPPPAAQTRFTKSKKAAEMGHSSIRTRQKWSHTTMILRSSNLTDYIRALLYGALLYCCWSRACWLFSAHPPEKSRKRLVHIISRPSHARPGPTYLPAACCMHEYSTVVCRAQCMRATC